MSWDAMLPDVPANVRPKKYVQVTNSAVARADKISLLCETFCWGFRSMPWNHVWAWGVATLLSVAPLSMGSFGQTESLFCGVDGEFRIRSTRESS